MLVSSLISGQYLSYTKNLLYSSYLDYPTWFYILSAFVFLIIYCSLIFIQVKTNSLIKLNIGDNRKSVKVIKSILFSAVAFSLVIFSATYLLIYNQVKIATETHCNACDKFFENFVSETNYGIDDINKIQSFFPEYTFTMSDEYYFPGLYAEKDATHITIRTTEDNALSVYINSECHKNDLTSLNPILLFRLQSVNPIISYIETDKMDFLKMVDVFGTIKVGDSITESVNKFSELRYYRLMYSYNESDDSGSYYIELIDTISIFGDEMITLDYSNGYVTEANGIWD